MAETFYSKADLHLHTTHSDGHTTPRQLIEHVARSDISLIAVTDHDTISGALEAQRIGDAYGVEVIVGEEVSTREGHLLVLFVEERLPPGRPLIETVQAAREQGALIIAAHPFAMLAKSIGRHVLTRRFADPTWRELVDAIEVFNAGLGLAHHNALAARFAATYGLPTVGGSDSHHLPTFGTGYTRFPGRTAQDLRRAVLAGQTLPGGAPWGALRLAQAGALYARRSVGGLLAPTVQG